MQLKSKRLAGTGFRGMLSSRQGALALALLCAIAAAGILIFALGRYKKSVNPAPQQATVLVSTGLIQKGEAGSTMAAQGLYKAMPTLAAQLPAGAITDASVLQGKFANADILPGQQLTYGQFNATPGPVGQLSPTDRGMTISLDPQHGLGGAIQGGDHVDLYGAFTPSGGGQPFVTLVVPDALVLRAPGADAAGAAGGPTLLKVGWKYAPEVAYAQEWGKIWLFLRGGNAINPVKTITDMSTLLDGIKFAPGQHLSAATNAATAPANSTATATGAKP